MPLLYRTGATIGNWKETYQGRGGRLQNLPIEVEVSNKNGIFRDDLSW